MFKAKVTENFLSNEDCMYLVNLASSSDLWEGGGSEFWDNRVINYSSLARHDKNAAVIMLDANIRCGQKIKELFDVEEIYSDTLQIIR